MGRDHDGAMDAYAYVVEQLRADECKRLRVYVSDGRSKFTTWLVVVARRLCLDHLRHRYGRSTDGTPETQAARLVRRQLADLLAADLDASGVSSEATADNPEKQLRRDELNCALQGVLSGLEPRDRLLLKLRFDDGLSAREIGALMGFPTPFHVYRRLNTLLGRLRSALRERGIEGSDP